MIAFYLLLFSLMFHNLNAQTHDKNIRLHTKEYISKTTLDTIWPQIQKFAMDNLNEENEKRFDHYYLYYLARNALEKIEDEHVIERFNKYKLPTTQKKITPDMQKLILACFHHTPYQFKNGTRIYEIDYFDITNPFVGLISVHRRGWFFPQNTQKTTKSKERR